MPRISRLTLLVLTLVVSACTAIRPAQPPLLSPFGDGTQWIVWQDIDFVVVMNDKTQRTLRVPKGFVTDLASTPPEVWKWYPPFGKYLSASILHDYLYWRGESLCTQEQADKIFAQTMADAGVDRQTQARFFLALKARGKKALSDNAAESSQGLIRVLPPEYLDEPDKRAPNEIWSRLRERLQKAGIKERPQPTDQEIALACPSLGNEIKVDTSLRTVLIGGRR